MELRKLRQEEHWKTRNIWERIFTEDTPEFLDYYYSVKTAENQIYVIEDENTICAMLQLNPYQIQAGENNLPGTILWRLPQMKDTEDGNSWQDY